MSEVRIDVTWRGLEVGRQVPLHSVTDASGRIDVPLPMPVGSALALRVGDGLEIPAVVSRVHEQSSAGGETAGMIVRPTLDDGSRGWWAARAEESAAEVPAPATSTPDDEAVVVIVAPADPTARPTMVFQAVKLSEVPAVPSASPATTAALAAPAPAAPAPTPAWRSPEPAAAPAPAAAAPPSLPEIEVVAPAAPAEEDAGHTRLMFGAAPPDDVPDDTSRTAVMAAVDVEAIMAESAAQSADGANAGEGNGDDADASVTGEIASEASGTAGTRGKSKTPRGKRRRTR
jgi:hypothetical protein